jgi:hypothetical protein
MLRFDKHNRQALAILLSPSWLSGLVAIVAGLLVSVGVIVAFSVNNSPVQQQLIAWQQHQDQKPLTQPNEVVVHQDKPVINLRDSWSLMVVWGMVGLAVYAIGASIVSSLSRAETLRESLTYVNAKPGALLKDAAEHIVLRLLATAILGILLLLLVKQVLPYSITAAHASAADILSGTGLLYAFLSFALVAFTLHLQTIFARLAVGRLRIFSESNV